MSQVIVAGAGPTGLVVASELRRAGISVDLIDRAEGRSGASKAAGMHARTMEIFEQRGVLGGFTASGQPVRTGWFGGLKPDMSALSTRFPYILGIMQTATERELERVANALDVRVQWSTEVVGIDQDNDGVTVTVRGPDQTVTSLSANYLVGCDGGHSAVRRLVGVAFEGTDSQLFTVIGDVELADPPEGGALLERRPAGFFSVMPFGALSGDSWYRMFVSEYAPEDTEAPVTFDRLRAATIRVAGTDYGMTSPYWLSRFGDGARQATQYRSGRVFLAGDAAHIHPPLGGQGMNTGIQDAANLSWKLAAVLNGETAESLLDSYHDERYPVAARVLANTRAQMALLEPGYNVTALRGYFAQLMQIEQVNEQLASEIAALDICYASPGEQPLIGRRVPDADITVEGASMRIFELLHTARPVYVDFDQGAERPVDLPTAITQVTARCADRKWRLPVLGLITVPAAILVRPDGYVSWASQDGTLDGLDNAVRAWSGEHRTIAAQ
jgi:2-polyprenyl-6-methoxyphenol hydroxylase-like FAD-dependent oxidoreductase